VDEFVDRNRTTLNIHRERRISEVAESKSGHCTLASQLARNLAADWQQGDRLLAEEYLGRHPELFGDPDAVAKLIFEEVCARQKQGIEVDSDDFLRRFPRWRSEIAVMLDCHRLLQPQETPVFPEVGQVFEDFHLLAVLGRGAQGCVYLATQPLLADRPVVLKLTPCQGKEHWTLARLQHTHIVPLFAANDYPEHNLRSLCMPYLGCATLSQVLDCLESHPSIPRTGCQLLAALDQIQSAFPEVATSPGPARKFLAGATFEEAVCWMGACLADALHYAHERGLVHLDLKPSNVLLTSDGQPMLLDFHLARGPLEPGAPGSDWLGGTPGYMSPEQRRAVLAIRTEKVVAERVDNRSDVYSLGVILYKSLGGELPIPTQTANALRRQNPFVSPGLADILARCLASEASDRYPCAAELSNDLRRHLNDQALRGVPNRSWSERWRKWRCRRPFALAVGGMLTAVLVLSFAFGAFALIQIRDRYHRADRGLQEGRQLFQNRAYPQATQIFTQSLDLIADVPGGQGLRQELEISLAQARRAETAINLNNLIKRVRVVSESIPSLGPERLRDLEVHCAKIWEVHDVLLDGQTSDRADHHDSTRMETDLLELVLFWIDARVHLAGGQHVSEARQEALRVLQETEELLGPSQALERERHTLAAALGLSVEAQASCRRADQMIPHTSWEHWAEGRYLYRVGKIEAAYAAFIKSVDLSPQDFLPHFFQGLCELRLKRPVAAVNSFSVCIALAPDRAECYYDRGLAHAASGHKSEARRDFDHALELDPGFADALLQRAVLHIQAKHFSPALDDLHHALAHGSDPAMVHYNEALVHQATQNLPAAKRSLEQALKANPGLSEAQALRAHLIQGP
jgi:serine/threonine protein kinase/tetratricopeptide (TPR) repeat protein